MAEVAVRLAAKAYAAGQRLLVLGDAAELAALDLALWTQSKASFIAHGLAGGPHDAAQPILLSPRLELVNRASRLEPVNGANRLEPVNGARVLLLLGHGLPPEFDGLDRLLNLFDDGMPSHARARADWKAIGTRHGVERSYWQQSIRGGWEKKA